MNIKAISGLVKVKTFDRMINIRRRIASFYNENLEKGKIVALPPINDEAIYSHFCVRVKNRIEFMNKMRKQNISIGKYYDYSIPELKPYRNYGKGEYPNSRLCAKQVVNLPNHPRLKEKELHYIVERIPDCL